MAQIQLTGLSDEEKEMIEARAEKEGMDTATFCRTRLRAGFRLWDAGGEFDVLEMQKRLNLIEEKPTRQQNTEPAESVTTAAHDRFTRQILNNLPVNEDDAVPLNDLENIVKEKVLTDVLKDLRDNGKARYVTNKGYIKVE